MKNYNLISNILNKWDLIGRIQIQDYTHSGYYGGVLRVSDEKNNYALKSYPRSSIKLLELMSRLFWFLKKRGFYNFPDLIPTVDGNEFVKSPNGSFFILSPWIDGKQIDYHETTVAKEEKIRSFARTIAQFHAIASDFPVNDIPTDKSIIDFWIPELLKRYSKTQKYILENNNVFIQLKAEDKIKLLLKTTKSLMEALNDRNTISSMEGSFTRNIIHADLWIGHWIYGSSNNKPYILDFDRLRLGRQIDDVERLVSESLQFGVKYGKISLSEYVDHRQLSEQEILNLPLMIRYGVVRRVFWLIDQFIRKGSIIKDGPLDLNCEIIRTIELMSINLDKILF